MYKGFNVRVYGLLIEGGRLLISDEYIKEREITKLPGGGLEFGEGTKDCIIREFKEELNLSIRVLHHFYTTDFFVKSAFNESQVLSVYYTVQALEKLKTPISTKKFDFKSKKNGAQSFRWITLNELSENDFTFVIDKKVATLLIQQKELFA
ncbi:MAG: NUDIX domain-containing protein [Bacteroidetes bacterium]|nr:NUDIX domain-containing protein [Bacteroidota bacterium]